MQYVRKLGLSLFLFPSRGGMMQALRLPQQTYASISKKSWQSQKCLKDILQILHIILLRNFLILGENLEYLQIDQADILGGMSFLPSNLIEEISLKS